MLSGCVSRSEVEMDIFIAERVPESVCNQAPQLWDYGIYRVVLCKNRPDSQHCQNGEESFEEFIPYCDKALDEYLAMHREDANRWLEKLTRPRKK
jgi:hypothetical protein